MDAILVTGGAGYIGSHAAKCLAKNGFLPVTLDNLITGHKWAVKWGPLLQGDIADQDLLREIIRTYRIRTIFHFAAHASVAESMIRPGRYFDNNVVGTLKLLDAAMEGGVRHVVFSSTCATYGIPQSLPILETQPRNPVNPYGESKLIIENVLRWYSEIHGISSVALRYFNAAGADEDGEIGEAHDPETHLIPLAIKAALDRSQTVQIFGRGYPTPDGTAVRDYTHVADIARAHVLALRYLLDGGKTTAINLGTGRGHSVLQVIKAVRQVSGANVREVFCDRRAGDPPELVADPAAAGRVLGWRAEIPDIGDIARSAWQWHSSRANHRGLAPPAETSHHSTRIEYSAPGRA